MIGRRGGLCELDTFTDLEHLRAGKPSAPPEKISCDKAGQLLEVLASEVLPNRFTSMSEYRYIIEGAAVQRGSPDQLG